MVGLGPPCSPCFGRCALTPQTSEVDSPTALACPVSVYGTLTHHLRFLMLPDLSIGSTETWAFSLPFCFLSLSLPLPFLSLPFPFPSLRPFPSLPYTMPKLSDDSLSVMVTISVIRVSVQNLPLQAFSGHPGYKVTITPHPSQGPHRLGGG